MMIRPILLMLCAINLGGCALIFEGTGQDITVNTNPSGAHCDLIRQGAVISTIATTPGTTHIQKTKYDITVTCTKDGFATASYINHSGVAAATVADVIGGVTTGGLAWAVDSGTGSDNKYDAVVNISLTPAAMLPPAASATPAAGTSHS